MNEQKNNQLGNRAKEILSIYNQIREEQNDNQPWKTEKKDNIKIKENLKIEDLKIGDDFIFIDRNWTENKAKITNIDWKYIEFDEFVGDKTVRNRLDFDTLEKMSIFEKKENETPGTIPEMYQEPIPGTNPNPNPGTIPEIGQEPIPGTNQDPITETTDDTIDDTTDDITNPNPENQTLSLESNISSVSDIHLEQAKEHAEERLRAEYARMHPLSLNKLRFFLNRNNLRQRYIQEHLETTKWLFEWSDSLVDKTTDASTRIGIEKNVFEKDSINIENIIENNAAINEICSQFLNNQLNEEGFKIAFRHIIERLSENNENIRTALDKMDYLWTNILNVLKKQKNYECLINNINWIIQDTSIDNDEKNNQIRELINEYVRENKEDLTCLKEIPIENLERWIRGQIANINAQRNNLNMRIQLLSWWKWAYKIDNEDQKEWRLQKISEFIDRHPWLSWIWTTGLVIWWTVGLAAAIPTWIWIAAWMWLWALTLWSVQFLKKRWHFTAEHEWYEKRLVRNENEYEWRINELNNQISSSGVIRRFILNRRLNRIRRDYEIYRQSTQREDILQPSQSLSNQIIERTLNNTLTSEDIIAWLVRLDSYDELWHNFLTSSSRNCLEKEYKNLHESLVLWMNKLGLLNLNQIRSCPEYATLREELRSWYNTALENFKTERRKLSLRSWAQTAAVYLWTSVALQYFFSTWLFTKDTITSVQWPSTTVSKDIVDPNLNQALLWNESQKILDSITQKTTPETFWETLTQQYWVAKWNIIKNNILEHLWSLKEWWAYELVNIAKNGGGIDVSSSAFHDTFNKLQSWWYNVNETWLKEATSNLLNW
jgi:hypothetical protein